MRHSVDGRKFGRNTSHRVAMLKSISNALLREEQIITTVEKAKEARRVAEALITLAKKGLPHARRLAFDRTRDKAVVEKLFDVLTERYAKRAGGYTRIVKISERRFGDGAQMAMLELVDHPPINRRKAKTAEGDETAVAADGTTPEAADPFAKMRGLFRGKKAKSAGPTAETKKKTVEAKPKKAPAAKSTKTARKAPAASK
jgi:large subunit ribosomal protein L17